MPELHLPAKRMPLLAAALAALALLLVLTLRVNVSLRLSKTGRVFVPWGTGPRSVALYTAPDGKLFGPSDFLVSRNSVLLLDTFADRIVRVGPSGAVSLVRKVPRGTVEFAKAKGSTGFYLADDAHRRLVLPDGKALPYPAGEVVRALELKSAPGGGVLFLMAVYGIHGVQTTLYYVGTDGRMKAVGQGILSVAPLPGGGFVWSDGSSIHRAGRTLKGHPGSLEVSGDGKNVFVVRRLGTPSGEIGLLEAKGPRWISAPQHSYATLGRHAAGARQGVVLADARPSGIEFTWYRIRRAMGLGLRF